MMKTFLAHIATLLSQGKTTGTNHSEAMLHYTQMNVKRMERWAKTGKLIPELEDFLKAIDKPQKWVLITEAWCGDAAHALPFIDKMVAVNSNIQLELKMRDENLDLMDQYLTNGGRSIPKLIVFNEEGEELFNWGPRPKVIQEKFLEMKTSEMPKDEMAKQLQVMFNKDKGISMQKEILNLLQGNA